MCCQVEVGGQKVGGSERCCQAASLPSTNLRIDRISHVTQTLMSLSTHHTWRALEIGYHRALPRPGVVGMGKINGKST